MISAFRHNPQTFQLERKCARCQEWKQATPEFFARQKNLAHGLACYCHPCNRLLAAAWRQANPRKATATRLRRYDRELAIPGRLTEKDKDLLLALFNFRCCRCGQPESEVGDLEFDHIIPTSRRGCTHDKRNRQPLCHPCNLQKGVDVIDYRPAAFIRLRAERAQEAA